MKTIDRDALVKSLIKHLFWTKTLDYDTSEFETQENIEVVNRAIDIAQQQLPQRSLWDEKAIYQRCVELFRLGAFEWYKVWC